MNQSPVEILDTILGYLGFVVRIEEQQRDGHPVLQIYTHEAPMLIGHRDQTLEDLQYLVNRVLHARDPDAPRVIIDVEHHRDMRDDSLVQKVQTLADIVRGSGRPLQTEPLNSYDRRIVHNAFVADPDIMTWSPKDNARLKRITLRQRPKAAPGNQ